MTSYTSNLSGQSPSKKALHESRIADLSHFAFTQMSPDLQDKAFGHASEHPVSRSK